jgi:hypothetical protein
MVTSSSNENFDWAKYRKLHKAWHVWGFASILALLIALAMMVLKNTDIKFFGKVMCCFDVQNY